MFWRIIKAMEGERIPPGGVLCYSTARELLQEANGA